MLDCQRCRQPLLQDAWAHDGAALRPALLGESYVVLPQSRRPAALGLPRAPPPSAPAGRRPALQASSIHEQLRTVDRLVGLADRCASVPCGVPLCEECAAGVLRELDRRLHEARAERETLRAAFAEIEAGDGEAVGEGPSEAEEAAERASRARELAELRASLAAARRERGALAAEATRLRAAQAASEEEEEAWHAEMNGLGLTANREAEEALRTRQLAELCGRELRRLEAVDVCEDVFRIGSAGPFGTINGLRLGRVPGVAVDWAEINAGLGQVALLLVTVAREAGARFGAHALLPMGSYSKAYKLDEPRVLYEIYGSGSAHLGRIFGSSRLDKGLAMLLDCAKDVLAYAALRPAKGVPPAPPHPIVEETIGGVSIRLQFGHEDRWTCAFRSLLEDLAWLLAWRRATRVAGAGRHSTPANGAAAGGGGA